MRKINIAIDGPAGSGKGTVAKIVANELDYLYIDSGSMYRLLTYLIIKNKININDDEKINEILIEEFDYDVRDNKIYFNDEDVSGKIRSKEVNELVSIVAGKDYVRKFLIEILKALASEKGVVMDGRDIASVVLNDAELKIYLDAEFEKRVERRYKEEISKKMNTSIDKVREIIKNRDYLDSVVNKALVRSEDSILVDTSNITATEAANKVLELARERINND